MEKKVVKIYHASGSLGYSRFILNREIVNNIKDADLVWFEGGEDIDPSLYGEKPHTSVTWLNPNRDKREVAVYKEALALKKPMFGTCRGLQLFSAMAGGKLMQDVDHPGLHSVITKEGKKFRVNSLHHQMIFPYNMPKEDYEILATTGKLSPYHKGANDEEMLIDDLEEVEAAYFPKINALGVQWHPEMMENHSTTTEHFDWLFKQIEEKLKISL